MVALAGEVSAALGLRFERPVSIVHGVHSLGWQRSRTGVETPVFLALHYYADGFRRSVTEFLATVDGRSWLLTPTWRFIDVEIAQQLRRRRVRLSALQELLWRDPSGRFVVKDEAEQYPIGRGTEAARPANDFRQEGALWRLRFAGREATVPDLKGMAYIAQLLARPGEGVPALCLVAEAAKQVGLPITTSRPELYDGRTAQQIGDRILFLQRELEQAKKFNDFGRHEAIEDELSKLVDYLTAGKGLGGRLRRVADSAEKARTVVHHSIKRAKEKMRTVHPELVAHLDATLRLGRECRYTSHGQDWVL